VTRAREQTRIRPGKENLRPRRTRRARRAKGKRTSEKNKRSSKREEKSNVYDTVEWGGAVQREPAVAVWVGPEKVKVPTQRKPPFDFDQGRLRVGHSPKHRKSDNRRTRKTARERGMDISWLTDRIAIGGGIWNADNMEKLAREGITHIIDMQIEFDDTDLAADHGIAVLWNGTDDDFEPKPADLFRRGVDFAQAALAGENAKLFIHCAAGVHRAPMMALAVLGAMGWDLEDAMDLIESRRAAADFADVYVRSVEEFLESQNRSRKERG
jgi:protein-tyrosine phosphatase